ncbi:MAG: hypothetical protein J6Y82_10845 [Bacteroidales bacterium]|nr:hypothetical protein [Bacteroidales bacterium]
MSIISLIQVGQPMPSFVPNSQVGTIGNGGFSSTNIVYDPRFIYIPFQPNAVNRARVDINCDIISYNFSGCLMTIWREQDGTVYSGHVSTGAGQDCTAFWNAQKRLYPFVYEFKPSDYLQSWPAGVTYVGCYGMFTFGNFPGGFAAHSIFIGNTREKGSFVVQVVMI